MKIILHMSLRTDVRIPALVEQVREEIRAYVEECAGVKVETIEVVVESTKESRADPKEAKPLPKKLPEPVRTVREAPMEADMPKAQAPEAPVREVVPAVPVPPAVPAPPEAPELEDRGEPAREETAYIPVPLSDEAFPFPSDLIAEAAALAEEAEEDEAHA